MRSEAISELTTAIERIARARAGGYGLTVALRHEPGADWLPAYELVRGGGPLHDIVAAVARSAGLDYRPLGAAWLLEQHAWQGASLTAAAMLSGGWVPDLSPANVLVQFRDGVIRGIALRGGEMRRPRDEPALAQAGHDALLTHLTPLVDALTTRGPRARRALWRAAGDRVAQAFLWCEEAFADPGRASRLAALTIAPPSPLHVPLRTARTADGTPFHVRSSCCLFHRVPESQICAGCPLHRSRRVRAASG